jgi:DNA primase
MAIPESFLDELRGRVGLAEVIARQVKLTRRGREFVGLCPFHEEKTPSFTVNEEKGFFHCFGCGAHGGAIDFVMQTENLPFREAVARLASDAGMRIPEETPEDRVRADARESAFDVVEKAAAYFEKCLRTPEGAAALAYLAARELDDGIIARFRLGFAPGRRGALAGALAHEGVDENQLVAAGLLIRSDDAARPPYERFRGRVIFPIADSRGRVIAFGGRALGEMEPKYLNSPETVLFHKGRVLYGLAQAAEETRSRGEIVVAEGYMDVIALHRAGFGNSVAPLGTALTEDQLRLLWRLAPAPVLCFDGDAAGTRAAVRAAERALPLLRAGHGLRFARLEAGEDPDSQSRRYHDPMFLRHAITGAIPLSEFLWRIETRGRTRIPPEERADLEARLKRHALAIADETMRRHVLNGFKDRLWDAVRATRGPGQARGNAARPETVAVARASVGAAPSRDVHLQRKLVALICRHPWLFADVEEDFGALGFEDDGLESLREALVEILGGPEAEEPDAVADALLTRGHGAMLDTVFGDPLLLGVGYLAPEAERETIRRTWDEAMAMLRQREKAAEIAALGAADPDTLTESEVERLKALVESRNALHDSEP